MSVFLLKKAAVLEDALDGVQDSPMLSTENPQNLRRVEDVRGGSGDSGESDGSLRRLESLREFLVASLDRRPDLPLVLCVKSEFFIRLLLFLLLQLCFFMLLFLSLMTDTSTKNKTGISLVIFIPTPNNIKMNCNTLRITSPTAALPLTQKY